MSGFWYVATPYTDFPAGHLAAYEMACLATGRLLNKGVHCFSPIAHSHGPAKWIAPDLRHSHDFWMDADHPLMEAARGLIVYRATGWDTSRGVTEEIERFTSAGKPIVHWEHGAKIPVELLP